MHGRTLLAIAITMSLLVGATGAAAAQPANGPPDELPDPVPEFVLDALGEISDFVGGLLESLGEVVRGLTPGGADAELNGAGK
ncbi:hypothetical protein HTZ84_18445 [Haloterrigena sp. SYSU A558-1]|uniref:Uncharacterized protein n=1 Tax=Haloterrigena gelatinilytica TaxID=2741724 RepID=A0A8J8GH84_9EURY|nr:hypothetical protein [Haloterrigena gelatinilytica]NUB89918.1 hypothetical protein [Haloterrigena gelatinilytica]NUC74257.1 hypothetical protein [Haloterrigena gelatinilytica]